MTPTIGIVTALPVEGAAVRHLVDDLQPARGIDDPNHYHCGWLPSADAGRPHRIVTTVLPHDGTRNASAICTDLLRSFHTVRCVVICGIAGGIPAAQTPERHVRLGDVVVATEGVVDYGHVWRTDGTDELRRPVAGMSVDLLRAARELQLGERLGRRPWEQWLAAPPNGFHRPHAARDVLTLGGLTARHPDRRLSGHPTGMPRIHYASVGSADQLVRDELWRNELAGRYHIRAIEMESSGIAAGSALHGAQWFVVRGIADYCDAAKNDLWHPYASLVAAAYLRALLAECPNLAPAASSATVGLPASGPTDTDPLETHPLGTYPLETHHDRNERIAVDGLRAIVETFQTIPLFREDLQRQAFLSQLPDEIRTAVPYHTNGRLHIIAAVRACERFPSGRDAFLQALRLSLPERSGDLERAERVVAEHWSG
jgi:nucleoside phosphorylase